MRVIVNGGRCEHETAELLNYGWESWESLGVIDVGVWNVGLRRTEIYSCRLFAQDCCVLGGFTASRRQAATAEIKAPCIFRWRLENAVQSKRACR
jgi:hypothetical protein